MPHRLLIVDDEEAIRFALHRYLRSRGFEVDLASSLTQALELIGSTRYDLMIADLHLDKSHQAEGIVLLRAITSQHTGIPIILLTAFVGDQFAAFVAQEGVSRLLSKPVALAELGEVVAELLSPDTDPLSSGR